MEPKTFTQPAYCWALLTLSGRQISSPPRVRSAGRLGRAPIVASHFSITDLAAHRRVIQTPGEVGLLVCLPSWRQSTWEVGWWHTDPCFPPSFVIHTIIPPPSPIIHFSGGVSGNRTYVLNNSGRFAKAFHETPNDVPLVHH